MDGHVEMSIRNLGDFTSDIHKMPLRQRVYLDGPYGAFTIGNPADMHVLITCRPLGPPSRRCDERPNATQTDQLAQLNTALRKSAPGPSRT